MLPDQPPTFRPPSATERPWSRRLEDAAGNEVAAEEFAGQRFLSPGRRRVVGRGDLGRARRGRRRRGDAVRARAAGLRADVAARLTHPGALRPRTRGGGADGHPRRLRGRSPLLVDRRVRRGSGGRGRRRPRPRALPPPLGDARADHGRRGARP
ncbi:hypothetical protein [Nocardioides sp. B-3]|uniref:hypothetical protein n=1 Tax=Nocardioides sp. B-3 TaxID=2895565 RepID=UPI00300E0891